MYDGAVQDLIDELGRLPGIGPKSAQRIAFHLLSSDATDVARLAETITTVKEKVRFCTVCGNVAEAELCRVCADPRRGDESICVVEEPKDVVAIERTREFHGKYHVLGGAIDPMNGVGPDDLRIRELLTRMLAPIGITVSRLASGLPVGGDLEYADEVTLGRAFEGRRTVS
jgi:recombination protein RecR